ncbi:hypothetical protein HID58_078101 [Brassica napus]|uniref:Uncharacterized protein n=1 Tax=Brassica napus TaxID=3708 RepID=A0ABQ7YT50_BRANA|nr:hypothetical protein HID58_078101 [Brassica napus]
MEPNSLPQIYMDAFLWNQISVGTAAHTHHHLRTSSFWALSLAETDSWTWKSILKLRPLAELFIRCNLGNGATSSFWHGPHHLRVPPNASVSEVCSTVGWNLRSPRSDAEITLHTHLTDEHVWVANGIESRETVEMHDGQTETNSQRLH